MSFINYLNRLNKFISEKYITTFQPEINFLSVWSGNESDAQIFICLQNSERIDVGIEDTYETFENKNNQELAISMFLNLLTSEIKQTQYKKGDLIYKTKFETLNKLELYERISMTWFFPFWKKTIINELNQKPYYTLEEINAEFNDIICGSV